MMSGPVNWKVRMWDVSFDDITGKVWAKALYCFFENTHLLVFEPVFFL